MSENLATIQQISNIEVHPNADLLEIASVLGFKCIIKKDQYKIGDVICFIIPDTCLPDKPWAAFYKSKSSRIRAIRLRNVWSEGVIESLENVEYKGEIVVGKDITDDIGVYKYEPPTPQDLSAKGNLPFGIIKTDESRYNQVRDLPFGELVDVTLKIDGQSGTFYHSKSYEHPTIGFVASHFGITSRSLDIKLDCDNNYTKVERRYNILERLNNFCKKRDISLALRGEVYGSNIQAFNINPHKGIPLDWAMFSVWLIDEKRYARKGEEYYFLNIAEELGLPTVPVLEKDVVLTPELIKKYCEDMTELNGKMFEGVVIQHRNGSFKVIKKHYDSKK